MSEKKTVTANNLPPCNTSPSKTNEKEAENSKQDVSEAKSQTCFCTFIHWVVFLFFILLIATASFFGYRQWEINQNNQNSIAAITAKNKTLLHKLQQLQADMQQEKEALNENQLAVTQMKQFAAENNAKWLLTETDYFLRLATFNLKIQKNAKTALTLLQSADANLKQLDNSNLLALRKLIAENITVLQTAAEPDVPGIYVRLENLSSKLQHLTPGIKTSAEKEQKNIELQTSEPLPKWKHALQQSLKTVSQFIVIQHHDRTVEPPLTSNEVNVLYTNLTSLCLQAEWALLNSNQIVYAKSLQQIQSAVENYFLADDEATIQTLTELRSLQKINISPQLPDLNESIHKARKIIEEQMLLEK